MRFILFLIISVLTINGLNSQILKGTVKDELSKEPLPYSKVLIKQNGNAKGNALTDLDGKFLINAIQPGTYTVEVRNAEGYQPLEILDVLISSDKITFLDRILLSKPEPNDSIESTIIFILYEGEAYGLNENNAVAFPIVLFENGEYIDPPFCYDDYDPDGSYYSKDQIREFKRECEITKEKFAPIVEKGKKLFLLTNGIKTAEIIIKNKIDYGMEATRPSALIEKSIYDGRLLTNNGNLGTKMIVIPDDMPKLPKRIDDGGFGASLEEETDTQVRYYDDNLIGVVDINLDGTPELIYECQYLYGQYYRIYSKLDNHWKMLFEVYHGF